MITTSDVMTDTQRAILAVFSPSTIKQTKKELDRFNKKTEAFLDSVRNIKIDL